MCYIRSDNILISVQLREKPFFFHKDSETVYTANNPTLYFESGLSDGIK